MRLILIAFLLASPVPSVAQTKSYGADQYQAAAAALYPKLKKYCLTPRDTKTFGEDSISCSAMSAWIHVKGVTGVPDAEFSYIVWFDERQLAIANNLKKHTFAAFALEAITYKRYANYSFIGTKNSDVTFYEEGLQSSKRACSERGVDCQMIEVYRDGSAALKTAISAIPIADERAVIVAENFIRSK